MKYQVVCVQGQDGKFGAWAVVNTRKNRTLQTFDKGDEGENMAVALDYVQSLIEGDLWNDANRD